jgi:hypothetical protein
MGFLLKGEHPTYEGWIMAWIGNRECLYTYYDVIIGYIILLRYKILQ